MTRGAQFLAVTAAVALTACTAESGKLEIRSLGSRLSSVAKPVPARIAEARGQLALGNVALALESFRKAAREQPDSVDAFAGMAECYDRMGRFDLSRRNHEAALALAPASPTLLGALAGSLDLQDKPAEALAVREEIRTRAVVRQAQAQRSAVQIAAAQAPIAVVTPAPVAPVPAPSLARPATIAPPATPVRTAAAQPLSSSVTVKLAPATPPPSPTAAAALVPAQAAPTRATPPSPAPLATEFATLQMHSSGRYDLAVPVPAAPLTTARMHASGKYDLAAPALLPLAVSEAAAQAAVKPSRSRLASARAAVPAATASGAASFASRLERLSLGEVALLTTSRSLWQAQVVAAKPRSTTIRFVPLRTAQASAAPGVRLLNAARLRGLAANTRTMLAQQGYRRLAIGDATQVRQTSLILYPARRREAAERLAAQFGYRTAQRASGTDLIVLLGRDAARKMTARRSG
jgi:hypothetical protein